MPKRKPTISQRLKKELQRAFPDVKFSVQKMPKMRSEIIMVSWTGYGCDGECTPEAVRKIALKYKQYPGERLIACCHQKSE